MTECDTCSGLVDPDATRTRQELLSNLVVGDLFHATSSHGASLICIVTGVGASTVEARRLLLLEHFSFDRQNGIELENGSAIDSVAPLPLDTYNVVTGLDRRHRLGRSLADAKLTDAEKKALLFIAEFYPANAL